MPLPTRQVPSAAGRGTITTAKAAPVVGGSAARTIDEQIFDEEGFATSAIPAMAVGTKIPQGAVNRQIFIVDGHDEGAREAVGRFLERLGFEAIILHEQANKGQTIIQKLVDMATLASPSYY